MEIILEHNKYNAIWDKIYDDFHFSPSCKIYPKPWLSLPMNYKKYHLNDMYALDWQHDCFIYNPCEEIPLDYWFYDAERNCNVYFPSYYPDGDYHFFASFDWSIGLYGHPWKQEIFVVGEQLIQEFEKAQNMLNITV